MENTQNDILNDRTLARLNVTHSGGNGDLIDPISYDLPDADILRIAQEAIRSGGVPGIHAAPDATLQDFVVERFAANEARPWNVVLIRPKTPFGM